MLFGLFGLFAIKTLQLLHLEQIDIILYYDDNEDKYIEENPDNILSINLQLYRLALKQSKLIDNILNKSTILCEPDVKFNK